MDIEGDEARFDGRNDGENARRYAGQARARSGQRAVGSVCGSGQDSQVMEELRASRQQTEVSIFKSEMQNRSAAEEWWWGKWSRPETLGGGWQW